MKTYYVKVAIYGFYLEDSVTAELCLYFESLNEGFYPGRNWPGS